MGDHVEVCARVEEDPPRSYSSVQLSWLRCFRRAQMDEHQDHKGIGSIRPAIVP